MSDENDVLPEGWAKASLTDVCRPKQWPTLSTNELSESGYPVYGANGKIGFHTDYTHEKPTILVTCRGATCGTLNVCEPKSWVNGNAMALDHLEVDAVKFEYVFYALTNRGFEDVISGSAQPQITRAGLEPVSFPLAPLAEQRRIVAKIEALQERSRKAREALAEVGPLLEQFCQSLLAAAFRGDLTADWRAANPNVEPASELLNRIRQERRQKWEQSELAKYESKGKQPPKGWREKYKNPESWSDAELEQLRELPNTWIWATVAELTENHDSIRIPLKLGDRNERSGPYPYYGAFGIIDDIDDYLFDGDYVLLAEDGKNLLERKRPISLIASGKFWVNNHAHILTTYCDMPLAYLECFFNSPALDLNDYLTGIDQVKLTRGAMDSICVPVAPVDEQVEIVRLCKAGIESVELQLGLLAESEVNLSQLDQSILAKAFRGELVPQDPNDEPASELLARIRKFRETSERQKNSGPGKATKSTKRTSSST